MGNSVGASIMCCVLSRCSMNISDKLVAAAMKNLEKLLISRGFTPESMISKFDFDGDGKINIDEFDQGLTKLTGSSAPRSYLQPIFSAIDINGNGNLEQSELMALLGIENKTAVNSSSVLYLGPSRWRNIMVNI